MSTEPSADDGVFLDIVNRLSSEDKERLQKDEASHFLDMFSDLIYGDCGEEHDLFGMMYEGHELEAPYDKGGMYRTVMFDPFSVETLDMDGELVSTPEGEGRAVKVLIHRLDGDGSISMYLLTNFSKLSQQQKNRMSTIDMMYSDSGVLDEDRTLVFEWDEEYWKLQNDDDENEALEFLRNMFTDSYEDFE